MHDHRNGGPAIRLPDPESLEYRAQALVLFELIVDPPPAGDRLGTLIRRLPIPESTIEPAVAALEAVGLAQREDDIVRATAPARYFEHLLRVGL